MLGCHLAHEVARNAGPPQAHAGRERLAGRPDVGDTVGREPLEGSDRLAVVAVLGVVVVLDDQASLRGGPRRSARRAGGRETVPVGILVRRREHDGVDFGAVQLTDVEAVLVDRDGTGSSPACAIV